MTRAEGVFSPKNRALTGGLVLTVTLVGFEALAVATVLPVVEEDLGGISLYGWIFSTYLLASLVGTVIAGREVDRMGPAKPFALGCLLFAVGLLAGGLAPDMPFLVGARVVQGLGAGVIPATAYATIGRCYPASLQPRMFAVLATAWVVPGLAGPGLAGLVAHAVGWRWVFLGLLPLVAMAALISVPPLARVEPVFDPDAPRLRTSDGVLVAFGAALVIGGLTASSVPALVLPLVAAGLLVGLPPLGRLVPSGTARARAGLPATILARGVLTFAFFGTDAFVPLAIQQVRHESVTYTGVVLTVTTLCWTAGAWVQERLVGRLGPRLFVSGGFVLVACGIVGVAAVLNPSVPLWTILVTWSLGTLGMGFAYASLSLIMLAEADPGREGTASASLQLSDQLGIAMGTGLAGAVVALGAVAAWPEADSLHAACAITAIAALGGVLIALRLPRVLRMDAAPMLGAPAPSHLAASGAREER